MHMSLHEAKTSGELVRRPGSLPPALPSLCSLSRLTGPEARGDRVGLEERPVCYYLSALVCRPLGWSSWQLEYIMYGLSSRVGPSQPVRVVVVVPIPGLIKGWTCYVYNRQSVGCK